MTHLLSPGSGSLEDLNEYLCNLSADADQFTEESRAAYVDLQNKVEANTNTINNYERDILELNQQEQDLNQQLNTISDSVECGATGKTESNETYLVMSYPYIIFQAHFNLNACAMVSCRTENAEPIDISILFLRKYKLKLPVVASYFVTGVIRQLGLPVGSLESNPKLIPQYQVRLQQQRLSAS